MILTITTVTYLAVLTRIVVNPLQNVFQKQLTQRMANPLFIMSTTYGVLAIVCLAFWPQLQFAGLPSAFWQTILATSLFAMFGNVFLVRAIGLGDLSVLGPINAYKAVVGMVFSIFLLHEIPGWWGLAGILLIITGSYVVLADRQSRTSSTQADYVPLWKRPEIKLRLAALVFSAIDGTFLKKSILLSTPTIAFFYWCLFGFIFSFIWIVIAMRATWWTQMSVVFSQKTMYLALCATAGISQLMSNIALANMPVGYALALFQLSALISVLFGYQFFNEQGILRKLIGAGIMVGGAVLITLLG
ncbi:DMT family transporter [Spirosoma fluviale]|uniref:EamA-like transporter family protein n=1 Tax=Spirosoma fluviale TaxID=1597977 RepID=A0A286GNA6_9BACT|nr:DMT family transporter [Spirosoma fluviale]SOD97017.1 EamA-like transporter family protein [Spirosoma fluviale]